MKRKITSIILAIMFLTGVSLLLYPTVSNHLNSLHQSRAISTYTERVERLDKDECRELLREARKYNASLAQYKGNYALSDNQVDNYNRQLNIGKDGMMGYVEIPVIQVALPIYHGTNEDVLQTSIGHLEWTSLPVGGKSTHCVLSGHRGLPSAKLFTNLDKLVEGDIFNLRVLNKVYTYEVDQILIVDPDDTENLMIVEGKDYCTLVTCTPYGVNTHRLLVRGNRIKPSDSQTQLAIPADATKNDRILFVVLACIAILVMVLITVIILRKNRRRLY